MTRALLLFVAVVMLQACSGPSQRYPLETSGVGGASSAVSGSLQVERIEGGQRLVIVELDALPPPERVAQGGSEYVVWLEDGQGNSVRAGTLRYDRGSRSGNLLATTALSAFTVRVTAESTPSSQNAHSVLVAERRVSN